MAKKLVLVDDEAYVTTTIGAKLRAAGYEVSVANNGEEGFSLATDILPDVLITDYQMPVLSGFEMSAKLRAQQATCNIPILMLTARGHHLSIEQLAMTNIKVVFPKPFSAKELVKKVQELVGDAPPVAGGQP